MNTTYVRLVGHRPDQPHRILLRDEEGRYFLRPSCGSRPVRITTRDAERLMREYRYLPVDDGAWHASDGIPNLGCFIPDMDADIEVSQAH
jgi:hypothetical protein